MFVVVRFDRINEVEEGEGRRICGSKYHFSAIDPIAVAVKIFFLAGRCRGFIELDKRNDERFASG